MLVPTLKEPSEKGATRLIRLHMKLESGGLGGQAIALRTVEFHESLHLANIPVETRLHDNHCADFLPTLA